MTTQGTSSDPVVVYLAGIGRSGSTLFDRLLGAVEGWWSLGEVVHLWQRGVVDDERCGCGERFSACPVWSAIGDRAFGGWSNVDAERMLALQAGVERDRFAVQLLRPGVDAGFRRRLGECNDVVRRLYLAAHEVTGARVLVDASKHVSSLLARRHAPDIDVLPVHLVRDSRGVAHSWAKTVDRPATDGREQMTRWSPVETSLRYLAYNTVLASVVDGGEGLHVRYEDLVADPAAVVRRVVAARDDDGAVPTVRSAEGGWSVDLAASHGIAGNPMRSRAGATLVRRDEAWVGQLRAADRRLVTALTLPSLLREGYPIRLAEK